MPVFSKELFSSDFKSDEDKKKLVEFLLREYPDVVVEEDEELPDSKRSRHSTPRPDYWTSVWGKMEGLYTISEDGTVFHHY